MNNEKQDAHPGFVKNIVNQITERKIAVKNPEGKVVANFPLYFGIGAALISAPLTLIAAVVTLAKKHSISLEKHTPGAAKK